MHELTIYGEPCGMPRARATTVNGRARMFTPTTIKSADGRRRPHPVAEYKAAIKQEWGDRLPIEGPVIVEIEAVFPRPKSKVWKTKPMDSYPHTSTPDVDNIAKAIMDALNELAYRDDGQVCRATVTKRVASGKETPHTKISIFPFYGA